MATRDGRIYQLFVLKFRKKKITYIYVLRLYNREFKHTSFGRVFATFLIFRESEKKNWYLFNYMLAAEGKAKEQEILISCFKINRI